jgi:hypothetical protein
VAILALMTDHGDVATDPPVRDEQERPGFTWDRQ